MNGNEFREWRENAGYKVREIVAITGVSLGVISRFENGANITMKNYQKLVGAAGVIAEKTPDEKRVRMKVIIQELEMLIESEGE